MKYKYILFDLDGTLLNTLDDLRSAVNHFMALYSFPEITLEQTAHYLGNGARHLIECAVPAGTAPEITEAIIPAYIVYYQEHCLIETAPYSAVPEMMLALKNAGCKMAVISNKPEKATADLAQRFFGSLLDLAIGEKPEVKRKPAPDMVLEAIRRLHAKKEECVYIGDTEVDLATAKNSGIPCIAVSWGFRSLEELCSAGAEQIAPSAAALQKMLLE